MDSRQTDSSYITGEVLSLLGGDTTAARWWRADSPIAYPRCPYV